MDLVDVGLIRVAVLDDGDGFADDDVQRAAVGEDADVVVEDAAGVEQRHGEAEHALDDELGLVDQRVAVGLELVVEVVFAKGQHGHEVGAGADGQLDEAFAAFEHKAQGVREGVEGFAGAADDDGDGAAHAFVVEAAFGQQVLARLARHRRQAERERVLAVEGHVEIGLERQEGVFDSGEQLGEAEGFGRERGEGAVRDDAVRVVAEDVLAVGGQGSGPVQAGGEVGGEEVPDSRPAQARGAIGDVAAVGGFGENDVDQVDDDDGPEDGDGAEEEECRQERRDAQCMAEDNERLETALERDGERGEVDAEWVICVY